MESLLSEISKGCTDFETVIVAVTKKKDRQEIVDGFVELGDKVLDWYDVSQGQPFASIFSIPHRLIVLSYMDYKYHQDDIVAYLPNTTAPILIFGRMWRRIPRHPAIIDGDRLDPDAICKMYWAARGVNASSESMRANDMIQ